MDKVDGVEGAPGAEDGGFVFDAATRVLRRGGQECVFGTKQEARVMEFLLANKGGRVSAQEVANYLDPAGSLQRGAATKVFAGMKDKFVPAFGGDEATWDAFIGRLHVKRGYVVDCRPSDAAEKDAKAAAPPPNADAGLVAPAAAPADGPPTAAATAWRDACREMFDHDRAGLRRTVTHTGAESRIEPVPMPLAKLRPGDPEGPAEAPVGAGTFVEERAGSPSFRVAIVGGPGAGKSTALDELVERVLESPENLAVVVSAREIGEDGLAAYLEHRWCPRASLLAGADLTWRALQERLGSGAWLFVDGVDEIAGADDPLLLLQGWLKELLARNLRLVVSCRQETWLRDHRVMQPVDTYRLAPEAGFAEEFVSRWHEKAPGRADTGTLARAARLGAFASDPLILALLCEIGDAKGEDVTSRGRLMELAAEGTYEWRRTALGLPRSPDRLLKSVARLAREALDTGSGSEFPGEWATEQVAEPADLEHAVAMGWLRHGARGRVGFAHALWLDYFAAASVGDWRIDLLPPAERRPPPLPSRPRPLPSRYRVFEDRWREAVLLWLGFHPERNELLSGLLGFSDGIFGLFDVDALLLAASALPEAPGFGGGAGVIDRLVDLSAWFPRRGVAERALVKAAGAVPATPEALALRLGASEDYAERLKLADLLLALCPGDPRALGHLRAIATDEGAGTKRTLAAYRLLLYTPGDAEFGRVESIGKSIGDPLAARRYLAAIRDGHMKGRRALELQGVSGPGRSAAAAAAMGDLDPPGMPFPLAAQGMNEAWGKLGRAEEELRGAKGDLRGALKARDAALDGPTGAHEAHIATLKVRVESLASQVEALYRACYEINDERRKVSKDLGDLLLVQDALDPQATKQNLLWDLEDLLARDETWPQKESDIRWKIAYMAGLPDDDELRAAAARGMERINECAAPLDPAAAVEAALSAFWTSYSSSIWARVPRTTTVARGICGRV